MVREGVRPCQCAENKHPHPGPLPKGEGELEPLSLWERGWGEGFFSLLFPPIGAVVRVDQLDLAAHLAAFALQEVGDGSFQPRVADQVGAVGLGRQVAALHLVVALGTGLDAHCLNLEITESVLLDSEAVIARLEALRRLGVRIAIDDFGTGYSSLNYLRRFPVDTLKIAKPFVDEIGASMEQERLASAILRLGATLNLDTVAEGIETASQRDLLRTLRCRYGQGYFFSHPLPARDVDSILGRALVA